MGSGPRLLSVMLLLSVMASLEAQQLPWQSVVDKVRSSPGYTVRFDYQGERGFYRFHYSAAPGKTRTEILPESDAGVGVVVLYDESLSNEWVAVDMGFFRVRRSLDSADLKDSQVEIPIFDQLFTRLAPLPVLDAVREGGLTCYRFGTAGDLHRVSVNDQLEIVGYQHQIEGQVVESMTFHDVLWSTSFEES